MNVESGSATTANTATAVNAASTSNQQTSVSQKNSSDKSFQEELLSAQKTDTQENEAANASDDLQGKDDTVTDKELTKPIGGLPNGKDIINNKESILNISDDLLSKDNDFTDNKNLTKLNDNDHQHDVNSLFGMVSNDINIQNDFSINNSMSLQDNVQAFMKSNGVLRLNNAFQYTGVDNSLSAAKASVDYTTVKMDDNDAKFFADLVSNTDMSMQNVAAEIQKAAENGNIQQVQKSANVSATLMNALSDAVKTNQPVRIDFDKDISVIIKVDKDGSITANFIPGDKAVEQYLKENIAFLRQRFDSQEISYKELSYSNSRQQQNQRRNNKENK